MASVTESLYFPCFLGKSDPFVVVHMLPVDLFPKAAESHYKTDIKKQTLEPFFNSKFDMLVINNTRHIV